MPPKTSTKKVQTDEMAVHITEEQLSRILGGISAGKAANKPEKFSGKGQSSVDVQEWLKDMDLYCRQLGHTGEKKAITFFGLLTGEARTTGQRTS